MKTIRIVTWHDVDTLCDIIKLKTDVLHFYPNVIIGISKGGLIPARLLCDKYNIDDLKIITTKSYDNSGNKISDVHIDTTIQNICLNSGDRILIVDDIYDTGDTLSTVINAPLFLDKNVMVKTATLHTKNIEGVNYYGEHINNPHCWVVYPWEKTQFLINS